LVTLYDPAMPLYAGESAPPEIDDMLKQLLPKLDFVPPLADFLYRDPYKIVRKYSVRLRSRQNDVNGRSCRALAFAKRISTGRFGSRTARSRPRASW